MANKTPDLLTRVMNEQEVESDESLLSRFVAGDKQDAFAEIHRRYSRMVLGVCNRFLHRQEDVQDAFQATFLVLLKSARKIKSKSSLASWLYGVAYRVSLETRSKARRNTQYSQLEEIECRSKPLESLRRIHDIQILEDELHKLPQMYRQPLVLFYMAEKSSLQVADELGISRAAAESRIKRGRAKLKRSLVHRRVGLGVLLASFSVGVSQSNAAVLQSNTASSIYSAGEHFSRDVLSNTVYELVSKEITPMYSNITTLRSPALATTIALAAFLIVAVFSGASLQNKNGSKHQLVLDDNLDERIQPVSFVLSQKQDDESEPGKLVGRLMSKDGGSIMYQFLDADGKKRSLKIDNSFEAQKKGKKGTMYLDGKELDLKSKKSEQIMEWMKLWNKPPEFAEPSGTLLNVVNGVSFTRYQFVGKDKTLRSIEIDLKTKEVCHLGGSKIPRDSAAWKQIKKWMKDWKPGHLFSSEKINDGTRYYFLSRDLRKEGVVIAGKEIRNKYNKPLDAQSDLARDVRKWLPTWEKRK